MPHKTEKLDPAKFDLAMFLAGVTPETRFVDIYPDRRLMAELKRARAQWKRALEDEKVTKSRLGVGEKLPSDQARAEYEDLRAKAEGQVLTVEVHEVVRQLRTQIREDFKATKGVTDEEIGQNLETLGNELDYWVLQHAIAYPKLNSPEEVAQFAQAVGDVQWAQIVDAWLDTLNVRTSLADVDPAFLLESSPESGGEES